jgi:hypothetical protein
LYWPLAVFGSIGFVDKIPLRFPAKKFWGVLLPVAGGVDVADR